MPWPVKHLNGNAVKVFWYLMRIAGGIKRTAIVRPPNVAAATGMSERQARQYLDELAAVELIVIADRARKTRQRGEPSATGAATCMIHVNLGNSDCCQASRNGTSTSFRRHRRRECRPSIAFRFRSAL